LENRLLLAFVLSLAVFIGWGYFLAQIQGPLPVKEPGMEEFPEDAQALAPKSRALGSAPSGLPKSESFQPTTPMPVPIDPFPGEEVLIQVSTGKTHFVISNRGGVIKQLQLPRFYDDDGNIIDLINNPDHLTPALALQANDPEVTAILQNAHYEPSTTSIVLSEFNPEGRLTLTLNHSSGLQVTRTYVFHFNDYMVEMDTQISAPSMASRNLQYQVLLGPGMGGKISSQTDYIVFSGATVFANNERIENPPEDINNTSYFKGDLQWVAFQNKYFGSALIPQQGTKSGLVFKEEDEVFVGLKFESVQSAASAQILFYGGTKELEILEDKGHHLVRMIDYGWFGNKFAFLVKPLLKVLAFFYNLTGNYGWSIIFMTFCIKILFFPLTHKSFKSMKGMQKVQPYVKIIQERNKDNRQKMNEEMMELYKKHKVNPIGGCLPMLLQIPVFIALYHALFFSIELRGAPFMGWVTDLSVADPYYVFPVLMGATMFLQQKMTPSMGDPMQQKIMMFLPIVFTFLFLTFPAGLVIYWTVNNILTISQQYYIYHVAKD
jgi:YidC/Oxa1 family membrane protein insertase|tara:strand:+ start:818 stop:2461 length:1644 start_codon:yes stop_codon:yes gene_type:complete